jgi:hypothetical protein
MIIDSKQHREPQEVVSLLGYSLGAEMAAIVREWQ